MGLFSQYTKEGHGISKEQANAPAFIQFFRIYTTRFWSMILLNFIYIGFCIPIITIGPATAGMVKVLRNWSRREHAFVWGDFWETFKANFKQAFIVGLINTVVWAVLVFDFLFFFSNAPVIYSCVIGITAVIWLFMSYYIYTMLITFKLTIVQLYKNAFIFAWAGIIRNIGITLIIAAIVCLLIFFVFNPAPLIWVLYFCCFLPTCHYVIVFITYPLIKRFMIDNIDPKTGERLEVQPEEDEDEN